MTNNLQNWQDIYIHLPFHPSVYWPLTLFGRSPLTGCGAERWWGRGPDTASVWWPADSSRCGRQQAEHGDDQYQVQRGNFQLSLLKLVVCKSDRTWGGYSTRVSSSSEAAGSLPERAARFVSLHCSYCEELSVNTLLHMSVRTVWDTSVSV